MVEGWPTDKMAYDGIWVMDILLLEKDSGILNLLSLMGGEEGKIYIYHLEEMHLFVISRSNRDEKSSTCKGAIHRARKTQRSK